MPTDPKMPIDAGVEEAREAAPSPNRTEPQPPRGETASDRAGERVRDQHPPEREGTVTPAPPKRAGPDVNDVDRLEDGTDRFLGEPSDTAGR